MQRIQRMQLYLNSIKNASNAGVPVIKNKIVAMMMVRAGISKRLALEDLNALIINENIVEKEDGLWSIQII